MNICYAWLEILHKLEVCATLKRFYLRDFNYQKWYYRAGKLLTISTVRRLTPITRPTKFTM